MRKKSIYILIILLIVVLALVVSRSRLRVREKPAATPAETPAETETAPTETVQPAPTEIQPVEVQTLFSGDIREMEEKAGETEEGTKEKELRVDIEVSATGFKPKEFTVKSGQKVILVFKSIDETHVIRFDDPKMAKVKVSMIKGETRGVTFTAPEQGDYAFYCAVPGHRERGEEGVMKVR